MQLAFALTAVSVFTIGTANEDSFKACMQQKAQHILAACPHEKHSDPCTSECASAVRELPELNVASCCAEMGADQISKQRCERMINQSVDQMEDGYSHYCPGLVDAFTSVLREVVPFAFEPQPPAAVVTAQRNEAGPTTRLALAAAVAGAAGASVALAITSWKTGKQDTLLAA
mgnify:CR=1 FL=1